jgi:drug/metabolite transporter (DMT)-like permease
MEVVFAAFFALVFGGESLTIQAFFGGILVVIAMFAIVMENEEKVESLNGN